MSTFDEKREAWLQSQLIAYDEALIEHAPPPAANSPPADDAELMQRLAADQHCVELLDRVRRMWTFKVTSTVSEPMGGHVGEQASDELPPATIGRFQIERELGRGGLGIVYLANDPSLSRQVAVKIPRFEAVSNPSLRRRFLREADAAARLNHPHVTALYEVGEDGTRCYLASEYCAGPTLAEWLQKRTTPMNFKSAARIVLQLADAVQHAHSRGVLHRDIKPSNVLLESLAPVSDPFDADATLDVSPKLTDFGMAKLMEQDGGETRSGAIIGTLAYMSPEQAEGRIDELDARTDVYSLGAILYELLTGRPPFFGKTGVDTLRQLVIDEPASPRGIRPELPRDLEAIALKCLAKRVGDRYATAHELVTDLERYLAGRPTVARAPGVWERAYKWARRRPAMAALMAVCAAATVAMLGMATVYNARLQIALGLADNYNTQLQSALFDAEQLLYAADMRLAFDAWHGDNAVMLKERLERHRPSGQRSDMRTFPWHFLNGQLNGDRTDLYSHEDTVFAVAWSPRGDLIATGSADGAIRLWDVQRAAIRKSLTEQRTDVNDLAFSPDGRLLASCGDDLAIRIWNVDGDEPPRVLRTVTFSDLNGIAFSSDGKMLAAGGNDTKVRIWDTATWKLLKILQAGPSAINRVAFSPDSRQIAASHINGAGSVFDIESSEVTLTLDPREDPQRRMGAIVYSHNGALIATASIETQYIHLWDAHTGNHLESCRSEGNWLHAIAFSPDDRRIASAHRDGAVRVREVDSLDESARLLGHTDDVRDLAISPQGDRIVSGGADRVVKLWDLAAIDHRQTRWSFPEYIRYVAADPANHLIAFEEHLGPVRLVDAKTHAVVFETSVNREDTYAGLSFSPDGHLLAYTIGDGRTIEVLQVPEFKTVAHLISPSGRFRVCRFLPHNILATGDEQSTVILWDAATGEIQAQREMGKGTVFAIAYRARTHELFIADAQNIRVWDEKLSGTGAPLPEGAFKVLELAISPDERLLAGGGSGGEVFLWDLEQKRQRTMLVGHRGWCNSVNFSPDGRTLVSGGMDGTIRLWDLRTLQEVGVLYSTSEKPAECKSVAFSADGLSLIAGSSRPQDRGTLHLWSFEATSSTASR